MVAGNYDAVHCAGDVVSAGNTNEPHGAGKAQSVGCADCTSSGNFAVNNHSVDSADSA